MAYDESLAERIRSAMAADPAVSEKKMFGGLAFLYRGLMFVGVSGNKLMARVGKEQYQNSLAHQHVREMDFTGRPMSGYVYVEAAGIESEDQLNFWLSRCKAFVSTLPARPPKRSEPSRSSAYNRRR
jgi:TfoX/Sxy family transcriptional regulator of competence genes